MGSDRARISYNPRQQYRSVVMQQGRVTLEADWNEAQSIASEALRRETLDIVGPTGTPDNGYAVSVPASSFDLQIGMGSMYVGGMRAYLYESELYSQQSDWLDSGIDPAWVPVPTATPTTNEYIYLFLREQEVSAVEDSDLKDVALGGPDTAQRTRLVQHVERLATTGTDCPSALAAAQISWAASGFTLDTTNMQVQSFARLLVSPLNTVTTTPCDPVAQGGYLGADNQLIRVQIANAPGGGLCLVWGYDDASFLYLVTVVDPTHIQLQTAPVDAEHYPQSGQTVEVLMAAAQLSNGQYVAAPSGQIFTLGAPYDPGSMQVTLPPGLSSVYGDGTSTTPAPAQVYMRVWEQQLPLTPGTSQTLGNALTMVQTGYQVTLTSVNGQPFRVGDYWMFAVRPSTPQLVYPERYLASAQPPDGPREWICPLGVVLWSTTPPTVSNCRNPFDNLVTLTSVATGGCCTVNVTADAHNQGLFTIQMAINQILSTGGRVCLGPGTFYLQSTISISGVTLAIDISGEGAAAAVIQTGTGVTTLIAPAPSQTASNPAVLITDSVGVSITDLQLNFAPGYVTAPNALTGAAASLANPGIMIQNSSSVTVERCSLVCTGNQYGPNPAVAFGGYTVQTAIQNNVIQFIAADGSGGPGTGFSRLATYSADTDGQTNFLITFDLYIRNNWIECGAGGVLFDDACEHAGELEVSHNVISQFTEVGVAVGGSGAFTPDARVEINDNEIIGSGVGVAVVVSARINNNDMVLSPPATPSAEDFFLSGILIGVPATQGTTANDGTQIIGNRITGAAGFGILIAAQLGSAAISNNVLTGTAAGGIYASGGADHLSITNNQLLRLVPSATDPVVTSLNGAYGISLAATSSDTSEVTGYAEITGNIIKDFATDATASVARYGIVVYGYKSTLITGNELINIGPASSAANGSIGIAAGNYAFDRVDVTGNVVRRTDSGSAENTSTWFGVYISGPPEFARTFLDVATQAVDSSAGVSASPSSTGGDVAATPAPGASSKSAASAASSQSAPRSAAASAPQEAIAADLASKLFNQTIIRTGTNDLLSVSPTDIIFYRYGGLQIVSVRGNYFEVTGSSPAAQVDTDGPCTFTDNQCVLTTASSSPVVSLSADTIVAGNNNLWGLAATTVALNMTSYNSTGYTVLGNVVTGTIAINGAALAAPWNALNAQ
jgi:hypothetical protein